MSVETLGMAEAARRLGLTTCEMVQLVYDRRIRYVVVEGIPRIPDDAVEEYRNAVVAGTTAAPGDCQSFERSTRSITDIQRVRSVSEGAGASLAPGPAG